MAASAGFPALTWAPKGRYGCCFAGRTAVLLGLAAVWEGEDPLPAKLQPSSTARGLLPGAADNSCGRGDGGGEGSLGLLR